MRRIDRTGQRREALRGRRRGGRRIATGALTIVFFALALGGPAWLWQSGLAPEYAADARKAAVSASANLGLFIREIRITGNHQIPRARILAASGLRIGAPVLAFDPIEIRARLERMAWVEHAVVSRLLPGTGVIEIRERRPFALWQRDGGLFLIDDSGIVLTSRDLYRFAGLPMIVGTRTPQTAGKLFATLASEPDLGTRVEAVIRIGGRRWDVRLDNGIDIRLPEADEAEAWSTLARLDRRHALLARRISAIDLRIPDRVVVTKVEASEQSEGGER